MLTDFTWLGPAGWMGLGLACGALATAWAMGSAYRDLLRRHHGRVAWLTTERDTLADRYAIAERELRIKAEQIKHLVEEVNECWADYEALLDDPAEYAQQREARLALYAEDDNVPLGGYGEEAPLRAEIAPPDFDVHAN